MTSADRAAAFADVATTRELRAAFVAEVQAGDVDLSAVFERADHDPVVGGMKVLPLLEALPGVGKVASRRALESAGIGESAQAGPIDETRRVALAAALAAGTSP